MTEDADFKLKSIYKYSQCLDISAVEIKMLIARSLWLQNNGSNVFDWVSWKNLEQNWNDNGHLPEIRDEI